MSYKNVEELMEKTPGLIAIMQKMSGFPKDLEEISRLPITHDGGTPRIGGLLPGYVIAHLVQQKRHDLAETVAARVRATVSK